MLSADDPTAAAWTRATTNLAYVTRRIVQNETGFTLRHVWVFSLTLSASP